MNKILKLKKVAILLATVLMLVVSLGGYVQAVTGAIVDTSRKVNLTIVYNATVNGSTEERPIEGAEFTIYKIDDDSVTEAQVEGYITTNNIKGVTQPTDEEGTAIFENINIGKYYIKQTKTPKNVQSSMQSFLIDLPTTADEGKTWNYDVTLYPKSVAIYGEVTLIEKDKSNKFIEGSVWKLQKFVDNEWKDYNNETYTTNAQGSFSIENLECGSYRLVELSTVNNYIMKWFWSQEFSITSSYTKHTAEISGREKANVYSYALTSNSSKVKHTTAFKNDTISWQTDLTIPSFVTSMDTFNLMNIIDDNMELVPGSIEFLGKNYSNNDRSVPEDCYTITYPDNNILVTFDTEKLTNFNYIFMKYSTKFKDSAEYGEFATKADLTYTNSIDKYGKSGDDVYTVHSEQADVRLGGISIKKVNSAGKGLEGAEFKIAKTYEKALNGEFLENLTVTTDENGYGLFTGLEYGSYEATNNAKYYWIVETKAPTGYALLKTPVQVLVNSESYKEENAVIIQDNPKFVMPLTNTGGDITQFISIILSISIILISIIIIKKDNKKKVLEIEKKD